MVLLVQESFPAYIIWTIPVLYVAFCVLVLLVALLGARRSRHRNTRSGAPRERSSGRRSSKDDDIWLAAYMSEAYREQYIDKR